MDDEDAGDRTTRTVGGELTIVGVDPSDRVKRVWHTIVEQEGAHSQ